MDTTTKKTIFLLCLLATCGFANAQKGLHVNAIFDNYGKQKSAVLIELAKDVLGDNTCINRYKSLTIPADPDIIRMTLNAIRTDLENGDILMESQKDGITETGYYHLAKTKDWTENEYILFGARSSKMTLIYIRGDFPPSHLEKELDKLKDLFIKVNDKQTKL
ncbi:MAG: hypothetical protein LBC19_06525 [Tannerella sp.]|jgi:hypothetical protein|nr:hypothetical protein [Tannerella sp.]